MPFFSDLGKVIQVLRSRKTALIVLQGDRFPHDRAINQLERAIFRQGAEFEKGFLAFQAPRLELGTQIRAQNLDLGPRFVHLNLP